MERQTAQTATQQLSPHPAVTPVQSKVVTRIDWGDTVRTNQDDPRRPEWDPEDYYVDTVARERALEVNGRYC